MNKDELEGKAKEAAGKLTGDKRQETEGKVQGDVAKLGEKAKDAQDRAKGAADALTNRDDRA